MVIRRVLAALALLVPLATHAADSPPTACRVLDPQLQGAYTGGCKDGLADGSGEARGTAHYRGDFKAGRKHGKGVKTWPSGDRYEGDFAEDRKEGKGTYTWGPKSPSAGEKYTGEWRNDRRNGEGTYEWPNGDRYVGPWRDDRVAGAPTRQMIYRARMEAERVAAVGNAGAKVCRELTVGIATKDTVRGTVLAREGDKLRIRIDDPGRFHQSLEGDRELSKGDVVSDFLNLWVPCV